MQAAPLIDASMRKLGYEPEEIRLLLITHAHIDHVGTLAHFKRLTGAPVAVMEEEVELLKSGGRIDHLYANDPAFHFEPVAADRVLHDGETVELGGVQLTARHTPGHTPGCTTWVTTVEEGGHSYRLVFPCSTSVNPGTRLVHDPSYPGIAEDSGARSACSSPWNRTSRSPATPASSASPTSGRARPRKARALSWIGSCTDSGSRPRRRRSRSSRRGRAPRRANEAGRGLNR